MSALRVVVLSHSKHLLERPSAPIDESLGGLLVTDEVEDKMMEDGIDDDDIIDELELYLPINVFSFWKK